MEALYVIRKPLLSEKSTYGMNEQGRYAFVVDRRASKTDIKAAVESLYGVKVASVNTQVRKGKTRVLKYGPVSEPETKKATVRLQEGQKIELF